MIKTITTLFLLLLPCICSASPKQGLALVDSLRAALAGAKEDSNTVKILSSLAFSSRFIDQTAAITYANRGIALAEKIKWPTGQALNYNVLGVIYETKSEYRRSLDCLNKALLINKEQNDKKHIAQNLGNIGMVYEAQSDYPKALEYHFSSLKINEELGSKADMALNMGNIGNIYLRQSDFEKGKSYYNKALALSRELGDSSAVANNLGTLAAIYMEQNEDSKALELLLKVLAIQKISGDRRYEAFTMESISIVYQRHQQYAQALAYEDSVLAINEELNDKRKIANTLIYLSSYYLDIAENPSLLSTGDYPPKSRKERIQLAINYLLRAKQIAISIGTPDQLRDCYQYLADAYALAGDYKAALAAQTNYITYKDSVFSESVRMKLASLSAQRQLTIDEHNLKIAGQQIAIAKLKYANGQKKMIIAGGGILVLLVSLVAMARRVNKERKNNQTQIKNNEQKFGALIAHSTDAKAILAVNGQTEYVSPSIETVLGYKPGDVVQAGLTAYVHNDDIERLRNITADAIKSPGMPIKGISLQMRHKDGSWRWIEATMTNLLATPSINGIVCNFRDVTIMRQAEDKLINANRLYAFISAINQTIVHVREEQVLYTEACRIATESGKFAAAWIGTLDTTDETISIEQHSGLMADDTPKFERFPYRQNGPVQHILKTGGYYICNDIATDFPLENWRVFAASRNYKSLIIFPIKKNDLIVGIFNLYSSEINYFNQEQIALLEEATGDINFALSLFEKEKERNIIGQKLAYSEYRLNQAQQIAHVGSWELNFATGVAIWSAEACKIYGLDPADNVQSYQSWLSFIHPDDIEHVLAATKKEETFQQGLAVSHRIVLRDGTIKHVHSRTQYDMVNGVPVGLYGAVHDVTEIKKTEDALTRSDSNIKLILDLLPQAVFVKNYEGRFVFVNRRLASLYGLTPAAMTGRLITEVIPANNDVESLIRQARQVIDSGSARITPEQSFVSAGGVTRIFYTTRVPYTTPDGERAVLGISMDITEQKNKEDEHIRMMADIVQRNKDLEQFSYIVSHNLRAPVSNIIGLSALLTEMEHSKEDEKSMMKDLADSVTRLDSVIKDLNYVLQIKNQVNEERELVDMAALLADIQMSISQLLSNEDVLIKVDVSAIPYMHTLRSYMYSVFFNLISNSIKYRRQGVRPTIEITGRLDDGKPVFTFEDNGLGIDLERRGQQVFGLYKRFHDHTEGKGVGLYMVKTQVETLGGKITVASTVNVGTTFTISFNAA